MEDNSTDYVSGVQLAKPMITIGIPVVKSFYLKNALECAISQDYEQIEIVVLNNAAAPSVKEEIRAIVKTFMDPRIAYHENESQLPMVPNWNHLVSLASGEFFGLLSDDDWWDPTFISSLQGLAQKYPECSVFHARVGVIDDNNTILRIAPSCPEYEDILDFIWHRLKNFREQYLSDFMVRTSELREIGGFFELPAGWGSDDITWFRIAVRGGVAFSSHVLFYYRENLQNTTNNVAVKRKTDAFAIAKNELTAIVNSIAHDENFGSFRKQMIKSEIERYYRYHTAALYRNYYSKKGIPNLLVGLLIRMLTKFKR